MADPVVSLDRQIAKASRAADRAIVRGDALIATRQHELVLTLAAMSEPNTRNPTKARRCNSQKAEARSIALPFAASVSASSGGNSRRAS